nr:hypothetical protein [Tanacetum cinerariifolium]
MKILPESSSNSSAVGRFNFKRTSLTGFPAQSIRYSNAIALNSPYLLVLITGTSQSRQHGKSKSDSHYLLIESSIHILDQNRYPVDTSLINLESRKSPSAKLFDADSGRISIHHCEY